MEGGSPAFACGVATFPGFDTAVGFGSEPLVVAHEPCAATFLKTDDPRKRVFFEQEVHPIFLTSTPAPRDGECGKQSR